MKQIYNTKNHNMCRNEKCEVHLAGKRESQVFSRCHMGRFKDQIENDQDWTNCKQEIWMLYFSPECRKHLKTKLKKGYMPTSLFSIQKVYILYMKEESK